eukprot:scaffold18643_cov88-Skeletonema_marinoi.AAC.1
MADLIQRSSAIKIPSRILHTFNTDRVKDGSYYEYIAVYCDDLTIASRDPKAITDILQKKYLFKLKGTGPLKFLLGCDYFREGKTLCAAPRKYIEKMDATYLKFSGENPSQKQIPRYTNP